MWTDKGRTVRLMITMWYGLALGNRIRRLVRSDDRNAWRWDLFPIRGDRILVVQ